MSAKLIALKPNHVADLLAHGRAVLVDVREPDEFVRRHVKGALPHPLSRFGEAHVASDGDVVFMCRSGRRTADNCAQLQAVVGGDVLVLEGGLDAWAAAGLPVEENRKAPLELMRQVQIAAGVLVLIGIGLGFVVSPAFFGVSAFVGAGLAFAGVTGFCGMARLLAAAPWNRQAAG
jgi:rhodanese-related sulfurtransferase